MLSCWGITPVPRAIHVSRSYLRPTLREWDEIRKQLKACSILTELRFLSACCHLPIASEDEGLQLVSVQQLLMDIIFEMSPLFHALGMQGYTASPFMGFGVVHQLSMSPLSTCRALSRSFASPPSSINISVGALIWSLASCLGSHA